MKLLLPTLVLAGALLPAAALSAALSTALRAASPATTVPSSPPAPMLRGTAGSDLYPTSLLVASAGRGLSLSRDGGDQWSTPRGGLPGGGYYSVVADPDPVISGTAYATNGDLYQTSNGGQDWKPLRLPASGVGPGGVTALACGDDGTLYAAGATVLAYRMGRWRAQGSGWPANARPTMLLATPANGLYAAAGDRLFHLTGERARWTLAARWPGAVDALALGPDRATPYAAVRGHGIWRIGGDGPRRLDGDNAPGAAPVYALAGDPVGNDLYVATDRALLRRHRPADPVGGTWQTALNVGDDHIVALQLVQRGRRMIALSSRHGRLYTGMRGGGQSLMWNDNKSRPLRVATPLLAALSGAAWEGIDAPRLPVAFTAIGPCAFLGSSAGQSFDVCGPFRAFYYHYPNNQALFGYPSGPAQQTATGAVEQDFEKARMVWDPRPYRLGDFNMGAHLAPVIRELAGAGRRRFPKPSRQQWQQGDAPYPNGYYVDPRFYPFWRSYQDARQVSIFGAPISQAFREQSSDGTGALVYVQYFENARLEEHRGSVIASYLGGIPAR
jgi:hypothetical protein